MRALQTNNTESNTNFRTFLYPQRIIRDHRSSVRSMLRQDLASNPVPPGSLLSYCNWVARSEAFLGLATKCNKEAGVAGFEAKTRAWFTWNAMKMFYFDQQYTKLTTDWIPPPPPSPPSLHFTLLIVRCGSKKSNGRSRRIRKTC